MPRKKETRGRKRTLTKRQYKKNQAEAQAKWKKDNLKAVSIRFDLKKDIDILTKLAEVPNKTDYLRKLIRADIVSNGFDI